MRFCFERKQSAVRPSVSGKLAPRSESPEFVGTREVLASGLERSLLDLTRGGLQGSAHAVGVRTKGRATDDPADQGPARSIRKAEETPPQPQGRPRRGGKARAAKEEAAILKATCGRTASSLGRSRSYVDSDLSGPAGVATSSSRVSPQAQSPHRVPIVFTPFAMRESGPREAPDDRIDGAFGS